ILGNVAVGDPTANLNSSQGTVRVPGGGVLSLVDNSINTLQIKGNALVTSSSVTLSVGSTNSNTTFNLEAGNSSVDQIVLTSQMQVLSGGGLTINITQLPGTTLASGAYNIINYSGLTGSASSIVLGSVPQVAGKIFVLNNTGTAQQLVVANLAGATNLF